MSKRVATKIDITCHRIIRGRIVSMLEYSDYLTVAAMEFLPPNGFDENRGDWLFRILMERIKEGSLED